MNILFLTTVLPYPPDSGAKIRDFNLLKEMAKRHKVTLISFAQDEKTGTFLKEYCQRIEVVENKKRINLFAAFLMTLFTKKPFTIASFYSPEMKRRIKVVLDNNKFDLIHCSHLHMAQYVESIKSIPRILDEHNIEFFLIKRYIRKQKNVLKKIVVFFLQYLKLARYESDMACKFEHCLVVSDADRKNLRLIAPEAEAIVISNGVDTNSYKPQPEKMKLNNLVFTGVMDWYPNEDGILYFYDEMWSYLKAEVKDIRLYVVGGNPSEKIFNLAKQDGNIVVTGYVENVRDYIAQGTVCVVPLRIGGGSRLKILEAMAMGKAIVSTSIGCEGLEITDNKNILIADTPKEFARKVVLLLQNKQLCESLGAEGRKLVENIYSWESIYEKLNIIYENSLK